MPHEDPNPSINFASFTSKQRELLELLADGRTTKEIAGQLGISESAANQRLERIRLRHGGLPRAEIARRYRAWRATSADSCKDLTGEFSHLPTLDRGADSPKQDEPVQTLDLADSIQLRIEAPWERYEQPRIVPRGLDGHNAGWVRGAAIALMVLAMIATLVLVIAGAQGITTVLEGRP